MVLTDAAGTAGFISSETEGVDFGDGRLDKRLAIIMEAACRSPSSSFPEMSESDGALEGTYRFLSNPRVTSEKILAPHYRATAQRVLASERAVVAHDSTEFSFGPVARGDLEPVGKGNSYGFNAHVSLAVTMDGRRIALGVPAVTVFNRKFGSPRLLHGKNKDKKDNVMNRWGEQVRLVRQRLGPEANLVHVCDREGDDYAFLSEMAACNEQFVVRLKTDRRLVPHRPGQKALATVGATPLIAEREVAIAARRKPNKEDPREPDSLTKGTGREARDSCDPNDDPANDRSWWAWGHGIESQLGRGYRTRGSRGRSTYFLVSLDQRAD